MTNKLKVNVKADKYYLYRPRPGAREREHGVFALAATRATRPVRRRLRKRCVRARARQGGGGKGSTWPLQRARRPL